MAIVFVGCGPPSGIPWQDEVPVAGRAPDLCAVASHETVGCVIDGDTLDVNACGSRGTRVRLFGVDAPELGRDGQAPDCGAADATAWLALATRDSEVTLSFDRVCTDVFGRTLAYVWLEGSAAQSFADDTSLEHLVDRVGGPTGAPSLMLNEALLELGLASRYDGDPLRYDARLDAAEARARAAKVGSWGLCPDI